MLRYGLTSLLLVCFARSAGAQPTEPAPTPAPAPAPEPDVAPAPAPAPEPAAAPEAMPAPAPGPAKAKAKSKSVPLTASYEQGKGAAIATDDGSFELRLALRNQFRFESTRPTEDGAQFVSHFVVPRSRLQLEGHVFGEDNRYKVELSLGDRGSFSFVRDIYVDRPVSGAVRLRIGQWKRPFNRQEIVSDFASELNERANTADFAGGGRDLGIALHNDYEKSPDGLEWVVGVFNGFSGGSDRPTLTTTCSSGMTGLACTNPTPSNFPTDFGPAVVARVGWNTGGIKGYSEGDLEGGPLRTAIGLSYKVDLANLAKGAQSSVADNLSHGVEADAMIKVEGLDVELGAYVMKLKAADAQLGVLVQGGYFVTPKRAQVAARFAFVPAPGARKQLEMRAAFNWYWEGHAYKWATDVGAVQLTGTDPTTMTSDKPDLQLRTMLQLTF